MTRRRVMTRVDMTRTSAADMSLRFALLGLLAVEPASGYDLKRAINRSTYFIWNATGPQIYNTLHKLREEGCITSQSLAQDGKPDKQIHTITAHRTGAARRLHERADPRLGDAR